MQLIQSSNGKLLLPVNDDGKLIFVYNLSAGEILPLKTIMFYRDTSDSASTVIYYNICSGNSTGTNITLIQGANYGYSFKDEQNRIWFSGLFRHADNTHFTPIIMYTYPNSCNSWKGDWDYWYTPNGVCFASGNNSTNVRNTTGELTQSVCTNYNLSPYPTIPINYSAMPMKFCTMPNNEIAAVLWSSNTASNAQYSVGYWYLDSDEGTYGTWHCTHMFSGNHDSIPLIQSTPTSVVSIMHSSNILAAMKSYDWGRTWGEYSSLRVSADIGLKVNIGIGNGFHYINGVSTASTDEYVRFICTHFSGSAAFANGGVAASSNTFIMKLNVETMSLEVELPTSEYGSGSCYGAVMIGPGDKYGDYYMWCYPVGEGGPGAPDRLTVGGMGGGSPGDSRYLFWFNESNNTSGYVKFDDSYGYLWCTHTGGAVRISKNGQILGCGASYFQTPDGTPCHVSEGCAPDIMSGNTLDPTICSWYEKNADIYTDGGACGGTFEILENR